MRAARRGVGLAVALLVIAAGCGGEGAGASGGSAAEDGTTTTETVPKDTSPFCVALRALEDLSAEPAAGDGSPADVLEQSAAVGALVEQAAADEPDDAPDDVASLFEDYRLLNAAIQHAGGDTAAAFEQLGEDSPELVARLNSPDAHAEAFRFFAARCGTAPP